MSVPGIVHTALEGEEIATQVSLGGEDELFITPSRTIVYRADGLLSDESVATFPHDADRLTLSQGRRKTKLSLEYALEGSKEFTIPAKRTEDVLHPVLAGVLTGNGITEPGETVLKTYRFSELTVIITSNRLVKHIGEAVWDDDFEQYHYDDVTKLSFEDGSVATQIVLEAGGRPHRIKAPNEQADDLRRRLEQALFSYHGVETLTALNETLNTDEPEPEPEQTEDPLAFSGGVEPLEANPPKLDETGEVTPPAETQARATPDTQPATDDDAPAADTDQPTEATTAVDPLEASGFEPATPSLEPEILDRLETLENTIAEQNELLTSQQETIEQLIEELRRGR